MGEANQQPDNATRGRDRQPTEQSAEEVKKQSEEAVDTQKGGHDRSDPVHPGPNKEEREKKRPERSGE